MCCLTSNCSGSDSAAESGVRTYLSPAVAAADSKRSTGGRPR